MKTVLITGASSGIGKACAFVFAEAGIQNLIICGRRMDRLEELKSNLLKLHSLEIQILSYDIRSFDECKHALNSLPEELKSIDVLINNAGLAKGLDFIHEGKLEDWETMLDTNIKGLLYMTKLISAGMVNRQSGHIINICSTAGKEVYPKGNVYCASKFAVDALTKAIRQDLVSFGIRVSQVAPGHVENTEFALNRFDGDVERSKIYSDFNPLTAKDVADAIYFIASRPAHVNIQDILMMGTQQASSTVIDRSGRNYDAPTS
ncbi:MAG TPA: SDR family NAD(P)-dependent oxidoreductase [Saprospiraceae bacterium]|nr:SDR family NAD(P)-dependent oxidoreductase [Saprospiraceae bacterium]